MLVAASTECFASLPLSEALTKIIDLEFADVDIAIHADLSHHVTPADVAEDLDRAVAICRDTHRLGIVAYSVKIDAAGEEHYRQFTACCRLAKATKVVTLTVPSGEKGTPFNEEVEHLRRLVDIASVEGVRVSLHTERGRMADDASTVGVLCDNVKGLGITLDPSHFILGGDRMNMIDPMLKYVYHVYLRDTSVDRLQVRVGQGKIEYGKLINMLKRHGYDRALTIHMLENEDHDPMGELRKLRLLLESHL